ncbi:MAG: hypothetical protein ACLPTL_16540 [Steroidobacteraceae bacterium]
MRVKIVLAACVFSLMATARADAPDQKQTVNVLIRAECKALFYGHAFVEGGTAAVRNGGDWEKGGAAAVQNLPSYVPWDPTRARQMLYKDPRTLTLLYVETDGRHVAAINSDGKLLWVRNPYEQAKFCPYRTPWPVIYSIEAIDHSAPWMVAPIKRIGANPNGNFVMIKFDSSQFSAMDEISGDFVALGQN